ncbi:hypothetical protein CLCR_11354 [Cladophialophora carrionii]|uniref:Uncharacterized protein n=1 Tax=Cladophialophora carrionii TaxID=86049 RepID=A0A1C1CN89_9EURO|nr:hypothetical protein CLCR_11354 [Cladophialophora carrionii]
MTSIPDPDMPLRTWTKDDKYLISTDVSLIPLQALNAEIFGASDFTWGGPLPEEQLRTLVHRSLCFGLYELERPQASTSECGCRSSSSSSSLEGSQQQQSHPHPCPESSSERSDHPHLQPRTQPQPQLQRRLLIGFARFITDLVTVQLLDGRLHLA